MITYKRCIKYLEIGQGTFVLSKHFYVKCVTLSCECETKGNFSYAMKLHIILIINNKSVVQI